jgi:hypothetical protein
VYSKNVTLTKGDAMSGPEKPKAAVIKKTAPDSWEVRQTDTDEVLGSFSNPAWAELFYDRINEMCSEITVPQNLAA